MALITLQHTGTAVQFDVTDQSGHTAKMDSSPDHEGTDYGLRPMQSLLAALGGCSGIDIISILRKQRVSFSDLTIELDGEREPGKIPSLWQKAHMIVSMKTEADVQTVKKALQLSIEKYCSVAETLRRAGCNITYELKIIA